MSIVSFIVYGGVFTFACCGKFIYIGVGWILVCIILRQKVC